MNTDLETPYLKTRHAAAPGAHKRGIFAACRRSPETEWFANIDNPHTRRAYRNDLKEFMTFAASARPSSCA
jgi:hypothetical protein